MNQIHGETSFDSRDKNPGNEADVHIFNFSIAKTFHQFHIAHSLSFNCFNTFI